METLDYTPCELVGSSSGGNDARRTSHIHVHFLVTNLVTGTFPQSPDVSYTVNNRHWSDVMFVSFAVNILYAYQFVFRGIETYASFCLQRFVLPRVIVT